MPVIRIQALGRPGQSMLPPVEIALSEEQARGFIEFATCLATKVDVLLPAILAIVGCITSAAPRGKDSVQ